MGSRNKEVSGYEQTRRFSADDIERARPGVDSVVTDEDGRVMAEYYEPGVAYTHSTQLLHREVNVFGNLFKDSAQVMEIFRGERNPDPAEMLADYQEIHGVQLSDHELYTMLSWMDDLCKKALRQRPRIELTHHQEPAPPKSENPGIMTYTKQPARAS